MFEPFKKVGEDLYQIEYHEKGDDVTTKTFTREQIMANAWMRPLFEQQTKEVSQ